MASTRQGRGGGKASQQGGGQESRGRGRSQRRCSEHTCSLAAKVLRKQGSARQTARGGRGGRGSPGWQAKPEAGRGGMPARPLPTGHALTCPLPGLLWRGRGRGRKSQPGGREPGPLASVQGGEPWASLATTRDFGPGKAGGRKSGTDWPWPNGVASAWAAPGTDSERACKSEGPWHLYMRAGRATVDMV